MESNLLDSEPVLPMLVDPGQSAEEIDPGTMDIVENGSNSDVEPKEKSLGAVIVNTSVSEGSSLDEERSEKNVFVDMAG